MANRNFTSQFSWSFEKMLANLMAAFTVESVGQRAALTVVDDTFTAVAWGAVGNDITLELIDPGVTHTLSVAVVGKAITVTLGWATGAVTTDYTALAAKLNGTPAVAALITTSGGSATLVDPIVATPLANGADSVISDNLPIPVMALSQTDVGLFTLTLADKYIALLSAQLQLQMALATDLQAQVISEDVASSKLILLRTIAIGSGSPVLTDITAGDVLYIALNLRNVR